MLVAQLDHPAEAASGRQAGREYEMNHRQSQPAGGGHGATAQSPAPPARADLEGVARLTAGDMEGATGHGVRGDPVTTTRPVDETLGRAALIAALQSQAAANLATAEALRIALGGAS